MKKFKVGDVISMGLIPCKKCGERHVQTVIPRGLTSWASDGGQGHTYEQKDPLVYIQEQRDEINRLLKVIRRLRK